MRFCLAWSLLGTGVVAATRFVGEFGAPEFSHATLKKVFKSPDATDSVWTEALTGFEKQAWSLQVSVANDVPLEDQKPGDEVSQLTMLSLVRGKVPDIKVEMCVVAFIGQFEKPEDAEKRVAYQACGLSKKTCKEELEQLAKSHPNCDFDLPKSCKDASGREWKKFSTKAATQDDIHFMSFASKPAKKGSLESKQATLAAINRPFLVLTYNYSNNLDVSSPDGLVKIGCLMARRTEGSETEQSKRDEKNKASGKVKDKKNEQKRGTAPTSEPKITLKATVDPGKGAANITQVSILVAAAALLSAALMAF